MKLSPYLVVEPLNLTCVSILLLFSIDCLRIHCRNELYLSPIDRLSCFCYTLFSVSSSQVSDLLLMFLFKLLFIYRFIIFIYVELGLREIGYDSNNWFLWLENYVKESYSPKIPLYIILNRSIFSLIFPLSSHPPVLGEST